MATVMQTDRQTTVPAINFSVKYRKVAIGVDFYAANITGDNYFREARNNNMLSVQHHE